MKFELSKTKGHILGGNSPNMLANIYMEEECCVCDKSISDNINVLRSESRNGLIICEECAYNIHCAYEANL